MQRSEENEQKYKCSSRKRRYMREGRASAQRKERQPCRAWHNELPWIQGTDWTGITGDPRSASVGVKVCSLLPLGGPGV